MKKIDPKRPPDKIMSKALCIAGILHGFRVNGGFEMNHSRICRLAGVSWRKFRICCQVLSAHGIMVFSKGNGYYIALKAKECDGPYKYYRSYAMSLLVRCRQIKQGRQRMIEQENYATRGIGV